MMSKTTMIQDYFTRSAEDFDALYSEGSSNFVMRYLNRKFRSDIYKRFSLCMEHIKNNNVKTILDVGCGSGRYALAMTELGVDRILGIDFSAPMIELALKRVSKDEKAKNVCEFICCDFMEFESLERFDVVIAMGFFDYINDSEMVLQKMKNIAKRSVIASFPSISFYRTPIRKARYFLKKCPIYFYKSEQIYRLTKKVGFASNDVVKIPGEGMDYFGVFYK